MGRKAQSYYGPFGRLISAEVAAEILGCTRQELFTLVEEGIIDAQVSFGSRSYRFIEKRLLCSIKKTQDFLANKKEEVSRQAKDENQPYDETPQLEFSDIEGVVDITGQLYRSGIYFIFREDKLSYIGQSVNVFSRVTEHLRNSSCTRVYCLPCPTEYLDQVEGALIRLLKPPDNGRLRWSGGHFGPCIGQNDEAVVERFGLVKNHQRKRKRKTEHLHQRGIDE